MIIGVLGFQGGIAEQVYITRKSMRKMGIDGEIRVVKGVNDLNGLSGIIIPGGESTTIGVLAKRMNMINKLREMIFNGLPILGICAGAITMSKKVVDRVVGELKQPLLSVMDIEVVRNYFGRQRESFEVDLNIPILGEKPFRGIFIRAPAIVGMNSNVESLAKLDNVTVLARQNNMIASVFHPELTNDTRIHELFIKIVREYKT
jgi:5'-phosphate synthase pdxT subunit